MLVKAGEENAGAMDIGDGLAVVFKIESHNHPTAVEPYQGAASNGQVLTYSGTLGKPVWDLAAASQIFYDNAATGIPATTVQDAIDQTWDEASNALAVASSCLPLAGGTMTGDITFNNGQPIDAGTF